MPIIAVANQKGGVGKTTTTLNLGAALQEAGKRVLLVDLDPQGNLSVAAGIVDIDAVYPSTGDLLALAARGKAALGPRIEDAIVNSPSGLDIVPANASLSAAELGLVSAMNRESMLLGLLSPLEARYDYILIDCLPSLGLLAINALRAASGIVIPVQADFLAMQGLAQIFETIAAVREQLNPDLNILGVLLTLVDQRTAHSRDVVRVVRSSLDGQVNVFTAEIRLHVALKETAKLGRSIFDVDGSSRSAAAYRQLGYEVLLACGDTPSEPLPRLPTDDQDLVDAVSTDDVDLRALPEVDVIGADEASRGQAIVQQAEEILVAPRPPRSAAPTFSSFFGDGWQRWLGESRQ